MASESAKIVRELNVLFKSYQKATDRLENPNSKVHSEPNFDPEFRLFSLQGRVQKVRGMINSLFHDNQKGGN